MTKREFLSKLEKKLNLLTEEEREKVLTKYEKEINKKIKSGNEETDVIKEYGNLNTLASEILKSYNINYNYNNNNETDHFVERFNEVLTTTINSTKEFLKSTFKGNSDDILNVVLKFLLIFVFVIILRIPFELLKELGIFFLNFLPQIIDKVFIVLWKIFIFISYLTVAVTLFALALQKDVKFLNNKNYRGMKDLHKGFKEVLSAIIDIAIIILSIPIILLFMISLITLCLFISLIFKGVFLLGALIFNIGIILFLLVILSTMYNNLNPFNSVKKKEGEE